MELAEISDIFMKDKKGYVTLSVTFKKEGKIMLRSSSGIQKWFSLIKSLAGSDAGAHRQQGTKDFWSGKHHSPGAGGSDINNVDSWLLDRQFFGK